MRTLILFIIVILCISGITYGITGIIDSRAKLNTLLTTAVEQAYYEGQYDALTGDIRISLVNDSTWTATKSAWNKDEDTPSKQLYIDLPEEYQLITKADKLQGYIDKDTLHIEFNNGR